MKSIISLILIAASIVFFIYFTKPKWNELKQNKIEVEQLSVAENNAFKLKQKIDSLLKIKTSISELDLEKINKMIPDNVENIRLIIDFDKMLQDLIDKKGTAYIYRKNNPQNSTEFSIDNPNIVKSDNLVDDSFNASDLGVATFNFSVSLTYGDFLDFLKMIESSVRIFHIESITFSAPSNAGDLGLTKPEEIVYNFNVSLKTYWLKSK